MELMPVGRDDAEGARDEVAQEEPETVEQEEHGEGGATRPRRARRQVGRGGAEFHCAQWLAARLASADRGAGRKFATVLADADADADAVPTSAQI